MIHTFAHQGEAAPAEVLAFVGAAAAQGNDAAVPSACVPVLTRCAACEPQRDGAFLFLRPGAAVRRCGWGERLAAAALLAVLLPLFAAVAALVLLLEGRPVFFRQARFGVDGRPFTAFKFRTMMRRSEQLHARLQQKLGQEGRLFKLDRDPRVTRLGGWLRSTFVDELPQLLNVAKGEMRFVGPRPLPASDQAHYTQPYHALRLCGMPGITGLWQVSGRNDRTFDEMCLLDYYYLCNRSARLDARLLVRTVWTVVQEIRLKRKAQRGGEEPAGVEQAGGGGH